MIKFQEEKMKLKENNYQPEPSQHEIDKYMSEAKDAVIDKEKFLKNAKERMEKIANM